MKKFNILLSVIFLSFSTLIAQHGDTGLKGKVLDENNDPISFANITMFNATDSSMAKAGYSQEDGSFLFTHILPGNYYINISFVGFDTYVLPVLEIAADNILEVDNIKMLPFTTELGEVVVAASKPLVEVKPDKTVFNVEGSVNAIGNNGLELLRKAPGVVVDNNDRLMLIGKSGVKVYIDGRQSILSGDDLSNYLKSLQSSQIEAIEIITQPSSRYEADGNAGIINIRLIKDKSLGTNANVSLGYSQATHGRFNGNLSLNNRTKLVNVYGNYNYANGQSSEFNFFERTTADLFTDQANTGGNFWENHSMRAGLDFAASPNATFGVLFDGFMNKDQWTSKIHTAISPSRGAAPTEILEATNQNDGDQDNYNVNGNYRFDNKKGTVLNFDLDYGKYSSIGDSYQPNYYYDPVDGTLTDTRIFSSHAPTDIDIKTFKLDYEKGMFGGTVGAGFKLALVNTDNNYEFYNIIDDEPILDIDKTNRFEYAENVNAGYVNYNRQWKKIGLQVGVRMEQTDSKGDLTSQKPQDDQTVKQDYADLFPSGGLTYQLNQKHSLRITYSRRIDRPNYRDLNPFEFKLDELTFKKGNPFLRPQYSNSISLGHTFNYTLNTSLTYTHTNDLMSEITDTASTKAAFITTENIANQDVYSLSVSYPFALSKAWNVFANTSISNTHNKADFGDGKIVDIRATTFNIYMQHSFTLPKGFTFEVSGWYNSPGIWGGNFATGSMWSVDAGIQKKIWKDRGNIKFGVGDIFDSMEWSGVNDFGGLAMRAHGGWESRQAKLNFTYLIGNDQIKGNRNRSTGLEDESKRIQGGKQ
ncbi:MAG TPA: TonB-dependent receptor [Saprospiraceae bacterium]|nr:TonB-dependent receptor [Saprospiraceae bacterium]